MKRISITLQNLFGLKDAEIINPQLYENTFSVSTDSRSLKKQSIFIAIKGERFDGNNFITEAIKNGASTIIIDKKKIALLPELNCTIVLVPDPIFALGELAKIWRTKIKAKVIGITGSNGKTTLKEMIAVILSEKYKVNKTFLNNNNQIGVPITILATKANHEFLVAELGTNHFGEIEYTANILQPDIAMITNIGSSHLEFLKSKKEVMKEKSSLLKVTNRIGGTVLINNDDKLLKFFSENLSKKISYGINCKSDVTGKILGYDKEGRIRIQIEGMNKNISTISPLYGLHNVHNLLAAVAAALSSGMRKPEILKGIEKIKEGQKRFNVIKLRSLVLIDDTYNANPESVSFAISTVNKMNFHRRKILVLGDMLELGIEAVRLHISISNEIKKIKDVEVLLIGKLMKHLHLKLSQLKINSTYFKSRELLNKFLASQKFENTIILIKGSRGMRMEEFLETIKVGAGS